MTKKITRLPLVLAVAVGLGTGLGIASVTGSDDAPTLAAPAAADDASPALPDASGGFGRIPAIVEGVQPAVVSVLVQTAQGGAEGSGVIYDGDAGLIVTNNHVVQGALELEVVLRNGERLDAKVKATDPFTDLAVIEVGRSDLPAAEFADDLPAVGELAVALGNPLGFENSVTAGIVSGLHRSVPSGGQNPALVDLLQTDAPISPGNSGGALVDQDGRVIGINTAAIPPTPDTRAVSIGFAIPAPTVTAIVTDLLETGVARHAFLGVQPANLTPDVVRQLGIEAEEGVAVLGLVPGGAAERAGFQVGDVIVGFDGEAIRIVEDLFGTLRRYKPGDRVTLTVERGDERIEISTTLADATGS